MQQQSSPLRRAALRPIPLLIFGLALFAGLRVAWWLLPLGLIVYAVLVLLTSRDPNIAYARPRPRITSASFRVRIAAIERAQREIQRSVAQADAPMQRLLTPIANQASELVEDAYELSAKGQVIEQYLARTDIAQLQQRIDEADRTFRVTADSYIARQLEETINALTQKQRNASELSNYIGRIQAQLQNITANLDNVLAETVRLRTADSLSANSATSQVAQRLSDIQSDMQVFKRVLDTALAQANP
jgi:septal ring factor EnvC (AmiA/AmiB activator)